MTSISEILIAAALVLCPLGLHAQKPALTENIDEKGRVPYYDAAEGSCGSYPNGACILTFRTVPAGFRLVVTHASAYYTASVSVSGIHINLSCPRE